MDGSIILLQSATISGGRLHSAGSGSIVENNRYSTLDGVTVDAGSHVTVVDNQALTLRNSIVQGTLTLTSGGNYTALILSGSTTIAGTLALTDRAANEVTGAGAATTLANTGLIQGAGQIGAGDANVTLSNTGVVDANGASALRIDTGATQIGNAGTMQATGAGGLTVSSTMLNTGLVWAQSGPVFLAGAVTGTGQAKLSGAAGLEYGTSVATGQTILFDAGATGTLRIDAGATFGGIIAGFKAGAGVDLSDFQFSSAVTGYTGSATGGTFQVTDSTHTAKLAFSGAYIASSFTTSDDGTGHVLLRTTA